MIPIYKPYLPSGSLKYAHEALDSTWLAHGQYLQKTTEKLQDLLQVKYVLPVFNGTVATHLAAKILLRHEKKSKFRKGYLIVPNNVYVAAWNSFLFDNEFELYPIDADINTWNFNLDKLDEAIKNVINPSVLIVHNVGNIINVPELKRKYPHVVFVEDNCEGFLGKYESKYTGTESIASSISFFGNKNITCGEGGAVIVQNEDDYEYLKCIHGQGQSSVKFVHNHLGYNYRMTNIQAAILYGQLEILPEIVSKKQELFETYREYFDNREEVKFQMIEDKTEHSNWMFGIRIIGSEYKVAEQFFKDNGVEIRPMFYPMSVHKHLEWVAEDFLEKNATMLNKECIILPSYPGLVTEEINHILNVTDKYIKTLNQ